MLVKIFTKIVMLNTFSLGECNMMMTPVEKEINEFLSNVKFLKQVLKIEQTVTNLTRGEMLPIVLVVITIGYELDKNLIAEYENEKQDLISQLEYYKWNIGEMAYSLNRHSRNGKYATEDKIQVAIAEYEISVPKEK